MRIIGDMPYYAAGDSTDTWAAPHLFELDEKGTSSALPEFRPIISAKPVSYGETRFTGGMS